MVDSSQCLFLPDDIVTAAYAGEVSEVDAWLRSGGSVYARGKFPRENSLLEIALMAQEVAVLRCVIAHGADVNSLHSGFITRPLEICILHSYNDSACFYAMIEAGARAEPADLMEAARVGSEEIVGELIRRGMDAGYAQSGWSCMHMAALEGCTGVIALLLKHGARVNCRTSSAVTPLMIAAGDSCLPNNDPCRHQTCATVRLLLAHGADLRAVDNANKTARDFVVIKKSIMESELNEGDPTAPVALSTPFAELPKDIQEVYGRDIWEGRGAEIRAKIIKAASVVALFDEIYAAGSWKRYANEPRVQLLMLRCLCAKGRAAPPPGMFANLLALPTGPLWSVLKFWRTSRDA